MLDNSRRHALTWRGNPNNDPAMRWKLIDVGDCKFMIENNNREILCTGDDLLDPYRRRVYTVKRKGEEYKMHAHLWHLKEVTLKCLNYHHIRLKKVLFFFSIGLMWW